MRVRSLLLGLILVCSTSGWSQERPQMILQKGHSGQSQVVAVAQLADKDLVATAATDGLVKVWNFSRGQVVRTVFDQSKSTNPDHSPSLAQAVFAPDGSWVVTGDTHGTFRRFSLPDGEFISSFSIPGGFNPSMLVTDGHNLYIGSSRDLVKTSLGGQILKRQTMEGDLSNGKFALSPDGKSAVLPARNGLSIVSTESFEERGYLALNYRLQGLAFSADGSELVISTDSAAALLSVPELRVKSLVEKPQALSDQLMLPVWMDGAWRLVAYKSGEGEPIQRVDFTAETLTPEGENVIVQSIQVLPDGRVLEGAYGGNARVVSRSLGEIEVLSSDIGGYTALTVHPRSRDIFTSSRSGQVVRWSSSTGQAERVYQGLTGWISGLSVSPDGTKLIAGDYHRGNVVCWEIESGDVVFRIPELGGGQFGTGISVLKFVDNTKFFLGTVKSRQLSLYSAVDGKLLDSWKLPERPSAVVVDGSGGRFAVGYFGGVLEGNLSSKRDALATPLGRAQVTSLAYAGDGKNLYLGTRDGRIFRWDYTDPEQKPSEIHGYYGKAAINSIKSESGTVEVITERGERIALSTSGKVLKQVKLESDYIDSVHQLSKDAVVAHGSNLSLVFLNPETGEQLGKLMGVRDNSGWVAMDRSGDFDGNDTGLSTMTFQLGGKLYGVDQFMTDHFRPGVLARLIPKVGESGTRRTGPELTSQTVKVPPKVQILEPKSGLLNQAGIISVRVRVADQGAGISAVGLLHNGHRLPDSAAEKLDDHTYLFKVRPVKGKNEFRATAFDSSRSVEARQDRVRVVAPHVEARSPRLHLLSVGIDRYTSGLSLKFAEDDANSVSRLFKSELYQDGRRVQLSNEQATLSGIKNAIADIAAEAEPQDAFVLYLAGHGTVVGEDYFFLPHDVKIETDEALVSSALSSEQLALSLREVPATKQLLVLDSCRSGAAVGVVGRYFASRAGLEEVRSQQLLARASGTFLIAATKGEDYAYEIPELGHGVLTFAILESLGVATNGSATVAKGGEGVTANDLLRSVSSRVPELSEKYQGVRQQVIQYSSGQDFLIAK